MVEVTVVRCAVVASCMAAACGGAWAAGGHHAVDDAAILAPGKCESESWLTRQQDRVLSSHTGIGCRFGPVEIGASNDYARVPAAGSQTGWGLQLKWAGQIAEGISAGVSLSPAWQAHMRPRHQGTTLAALFTWAARDDVALHLNLGRDFLRGGGSVNRSGIALEWAPAKAWALTGERYAEDRSQFFRTSVRWIASDDFAIDLGHARRLSGPGVSSWTIGTIWLLDAPWR